MTIDVEKALIDPAAVFAAPEDVVSHAELSKDRKIEILRRWAYDVSEDSVALEEGMPGRADGALLQRIVQLLDALTGGIDVEAVGPTKHHGILRPRK